MAGFGDMAGACIVGSAQSQYSKAPNGNTPLGLIAETVYDLLIRYDLSPQDVDGLAVSSFQLAPDNVVTVAERLGLTLRHGFQGAHGGASGVVSVMEGARAITAGRAEVVVCVGADSFSVESHMRMLDQTFSSAMRDYLGPYPFGGTNGLFALVERAHRETFGTSREQLGKLAITQRSNAVDNENALLRDVLSMGDYLSARLIADPIRLYDCVMPCTGADAVLLTSKSFAAQRGWKQIELLAAEQTHNYSPQESLSLITGAAEFSSRLFASAGIRHSDLDFIQLYDDYPIMVLVQLEDLGFAEKGEGGAFIDTTDFARDGDLPLNTGGGQLSCGQAGASGGMIGMYEAVEQMLGTAGPRQLASAEMGLVSGFGMVGYGKGLSSAATILKRSV